MDLWALAKRSAALFVRERKGNAFDAQKFVSGNRPASNLGEKDD
jgi:hypothetical protein